LLVECFSPLRYYKNSQFSKQMTRINIKDPESGKSVILEINKVDIPTGAGWSVMLPDGKKFLMKKCNSKWEATADDNIISGFVFAIGNEINQLIEADALNTCSGKSHRGVNPLPRRASMMRYEL
jgi:hypothetical protein